MNQFEPWEEPLPEDYNPKTYNKPLSEWTALEIAIYACNAGNSEEKIEEVERMIKAFSESKKELTL